MVTSGAAAGLLLGTAACITGLAPGKMGRLPDTRGAKSEVIMVRSQRNFYDHAVRTTGARIVEVGLPDRYAGAGVRDAEPWEIEDAIGADSGRVLRGEPAITAAADGGRTSGHHGRCPGDRGCRRDNCLPPATCGASYRKARTW